MQEKQSKIVHCYQRLDVLKKDTYTSMGIRFKVSGLSENVEEFDSLAKRVGACFEAGLAHHMAHTHLGLVRTAISEKLEEITGIARESKTREDRCVVYTQTELGHHLKAVERELADDNRSIQDSDIMPELVKTASEVPLDLTKAPRASGGGNKVTKKWLTLAKQSIVDAGKTEEFAAKHGVKLEGLDEEQVVIVLARKARDLLTAKLKAAEKSIIG